MINNDGNKNPAVVLGLGPTGLALVRSLGRRGVEVRGVGLTRFETGFFSRYCKPLGVADPRKEEEYLLDLMIKFGKEIKQKAVLFATGDEYLIFLAKHSEELEKFYIFPDLDKEILDNFLNKKKFYELCIKHGLLIPDTYFPKNVNDIKPISKKIRYPCILKPIYTHIWAEEFGLRKAIKVYSEEELIKEFMQLKRMRENIIIQEVVQGDDDQIYFFAAYFDLNSSPHSIFTGRKLRQYPLEFGTTTLAESVLEPQVAELSVNFLRAIKFHGICDVEFKKDPRDDQFKMIEINPRVGRWYSLLDRVNANVVYNAYLDLIGERMEESKIISGNIKWILLSRDILSAFAYIRSGRISIKQWLFSLRGEWEEALFVKDDPLPFFIYPLEGVEKICNFFSHMLQKNKKAVKN